MPIKKQKFGVPFSELFLPAAREPNYILGRLSFSAGPALTQNT